MEEQFVEQQHGSALESGLNLVASFGRGGLAFICWSELLFLFLDFDKKKMRWREDFR